MVVAIKVIRPETLKDAAAARDLERRFKRELLLARNVTHKNVVRIHDLGEVNGIKYITMLYVHGSDLAKLISREGRLPVPRALAIARQIAAGLVAAHEAGIVHRDLKPGNILLDEEDHASSPTSASRVQFPDRVGARLPERSSARSSTWRPSRRRA